MLWEDQHVQSSMKSSSVAQNSKQHAKAGSEYAEPLITNQISLLASELFCLMFTEVPNLGPQATYALCGYRINTVH